MDGPGTLDPPSEFPVFIDYGQLFVFVPGVPRAGLLWTRDHVRQGFAAAPGIVCFGMRDEGGEDLVRVGLAGHAAVEPDALWAVRVPFDVGRDGVEVGTVGAWHAVPVPPGRYALVFQVLPGPLPGTGASAETGEPYRRVLRLGFRPDPDPGFAILRRGGEIEVDEVLSVLADYA